MGKSLKALLGLLSMLDRYVELMSLQKGERDVLKQVLAASDRDEGVSMSEILASSTASRASTYRHVSNLIDRNLVHETFADGERVLVSANRAEELDQAVQDLARKLF